MSDEKIEEFDTDEFGDPIKGGVTFGAPGLPQDKVIEALGEALSPESHKEGDKYNITYAEMREIRKDAQPGVLVNWGCEKIGFGQLVLSTRDGVVEIDDECMSKEFVKAVFNYIIDEAYKE